MSATEKLCNEPGAQSQFSEDCARTANDFQGLEEPREVLNLFCQQIETLQQLHNLVLRPICHSLKDPSVLHRGRGGVLKQIHILRCFPNRSGNIMSVSSNNMNVSSYLIQTISEEPDIVVGNVLEKLLKSESRLVAILRMSLIFLG